MESNNKVLEFDTGLSEKTSIIFISLFPIAVVLPFLLYRLDSGLIGSIRGGSYKLFELYSLFTSVLIGAILILELRKRDFGKLTSFVPTILFAGTAFYFLMVLSEFPFKSIDYNCFERAGRMLNIGANPYVHTKYEYPPLMAQLMHLSYKLFFYSSSFLNIPLSDNGIWLVIFYFYQALQFVLLLIAFMLLKQLASKIGFKEPYTSIIVAVLCVVNVPLYRTILFNQTNLLILDAMLFAVLFSDKYVKTSGVLVAFGALFKLYPFLVFLPWLVLRKTKQFVYSLMYLVGIILIQSGLFKDFTLFKQYLFFFFNDYPHYTQYRNNCISSLIGNSIKVLNWHTVHIDTSMLWKIAGILSSLATLFIIGWFAIRAFQRERSYMTSAKSVLQPDIVSSMAKERAIGHYLVIFPLMLLVAPTIWEHHFMFVIPFAIWAIAKNGRERPLMLLLSLILIFAIPVVEVYPISYHRLLGLLLLVYLVKPDCVLLERN